MAFPTTSILDDFGGTLGGWTNSAYTNSDLVISAAQVTGTAASFGSGQWNGGPYTTTEVFCTLSTFGGTGKEVHLHARDDAADGSANYYMLMFQIDGSGDMPWSINRVRQNGDVENTPILSATISAPATGSKMGMLVSGTGATVTVESWYQSSGGSWVSQGSFGDTDANRRTNAGKLGLDIFDNVWRIDDFGGGETVTAIDGGPVAWIKA